jgi:hypothetical protein
VSWRSPTARSPTKPSTNYPPARRVEHLRSIPVSVGTLPARDEQMTRLEHWITRIIADGPDPVRQIAIRNIGHDQPTLLITNDLTTPTTPAKDLFTRYAERMIIENELDADISGFWRKSASASSWDR